jgi:hypothetical protein
VSATLPLPAADTLPKDEPAEASREPQAAPAPYSRRHAHASRRASDSAEARTFSPFVPLLVFFLAWLAWAAFQAVQLHEENKTLQALRASQQDQMQQANKVRQTLDALALETQKLADAGNTNAKLVIDELRKRGITVNRPKAAPPGK